MLSKLFYKGPGLPDPPAETVWRLLSEMAGVLLTLFYSRKKLDRALDGWLAALKAASESVEAARRP